MNFRDDFDRIHKKLDGLDNKLDEHLDRISTAETNIDWIKGHIKIVTTFAVTVFVTVVTALFKFFK